MKSILLIISLLTLVAIVLKVHSKPNKNEPLTSPSPAPRVEHLKVKVSIPYWDQERAVKSFKDNVDKINLISLFWYFTSDNGQIKKYEYAKLDSSVIDFAHEHGIKVEVVITNLPEEGDWDSSRVEKVIRNNELLHKHIEEIVALAGELGIDGIDIDYEQLNKNLTDDFSQFIGKLAEALHEHGKYLGIALHPKSDDGIGLENGSKAQDWKKLSQGADNLYIMAFGEHWDEGGPGPVASLPWVERIVKYAQSLGIDERKLFLTIPLYGYDWQKDRSQKAKGLTYDQVQKLLINQRTHEEWDSEASSPHFNYQTAAGKHDVWFENARSVAEKINLADQAGFTGVTFWRLGGEDPSVWKKVQEPPNKTL